ncbi:MAG: low molecular weight phosphatase family protein [Bryobacteraceae bacterium]
MGITRVLFLCIGNSCRSPMAEGFAKCYGTDVMEAQSAGIAPAPIVQPLTKKVMEEKNINIDHISPKDLGAVDLSSFDLVINISGRKLPANARLQIHDWTVDDPIGKDESAYVAVRDKIEMLVMRLILELRKKASPGRPVRTPKKTNGPAHIS